MFVCKNLFDRENPLDFSGKGSNEGVKWLISGEKKINVNPLSANPSKWSNTLKQFVG